MTSHAPWRRRGQPRNIRGDLSEDLVVWQPPRLRHGGLIDSYAVSLA